MQTKLTLRLESELIQNAKKKAKEQGKSLSQIVADYFKSLSEYPTGNHRFLPITKSLIGLIDPEGVDISDYKKHLKDKYL